MVELISSPAFSGFSSATALIIIVAQLKSILGIKYRARNFFDNFFKLYEMAPQIRPADTVVGIAGCFLLLLLRVKIIIFFILSDSILQYGTI